MEPLTLVGIVAGLLTSMGFVPQVVKGLKTRRMHDVSLLMPAVLGAGMALWLLYGFAKNDIAIIFANALGVILTVALCVMKVFYDR